jgi:hypothetical protein
MEGMGIGFYLNSKHEALNPNDKNSKQNNDRYHKNSYVGANGGLPESEFFYNIYQKRKGRIAEAVP